MRALLLALIGLVLLFDVALVGYMFFCQSGTCSFLTPKSSITNFQECVSAGYPVVGSDLKQCKVGKHIFIDASLGIEVKTEIISTTTPTTTDIYKQQSDSDNQDENSGISALITIGPICPVVREDQEQECADKPYQALFNIKTANGDIITAISSNPQGNFSIELAPGDYIVEPLYGQNQLPRASAQLVTVKPNTFSHIDIKFDSGIR